MNFCHQTAIPLQSWVQLIFLIFLSHIFFSLQTINRERKGNPIVSVLFTGLTVGLLFFYGSLNAIAQLCSVLYLLSYSAINASCFFLDAFSAPNFRYFCTSLNNRLCIHPIEAGLRKTSFWFSYRPTFKYFHANASLIGFVLSMLTMFAINYQCALIALFGCLVSCYMISQLKV